MGRHRDRRAWGSVLASTALFWAVILPTVVADLPFTWTRPQQCTPLNITWTPEADAFPYSVYIIGNGSNVESYRITEQYQPKVDRITFQYNVPQPAEDFQSFVISIADAKGNGNTSEVLPINNGSDAQKLCAPYAQRNEFYYSDVPVAEKDDARTSCGQITFRAEKLYDWEPYKGRAPFSLTLVPVGQPPITVNIPSAFVRNDSYFDYTTILPFRKGVQFLSFMSDATRGGNGGSSKLYNTVAGNDTGCLTPGYSLANANRTSKLPLSMNLAVSQAQTASSQRTLIGGVVGAVIGVSVILVIIAGYLIYRRRKKKRRESERREQPQFVDLDDEEMNGSQKGRRLFGQRPQSYHFHPFTYEPTTCSSPLISEAIPFREEGVDRPTKGAASSKALRRAHVDELPPDARSCSDEGTYRSDLDSLPESAFWQCSAGAADHSLRSADRVGRACVDVNGMYTKHYSTPLTLTTMSATRGGTQNVSHESYKPSDGDHRAT